MVAHLASLAPLPLDSPRGPEALEGRESLSPSKVFVRLSSAMEQSFCLSSSPDKQKSILLADLRLLMSDLWFFSASLR